MTEFETKLLAIFTEAVEELNNIAGHLDEIETKLNDIHDEQCYPGDQRRRDRAEHRKNNPVDPNDPNNKVPF